ncbi:hypothetical protein LXL04_002182 [Taraxacum kok-saghyz]
MHTPTRLLHLDYRPLAPISYTCCFPPCEFNSPATTFSEYETPSLFPRPRAKDGGADERLAVAGESTFPNTGEPPTSGAVPCTSSSSSSDKKPCLQSSSKSPSSSSDSVSVYMLFVHSVGCHSPSSFTQDLKPVSPTITVRKRRTEAAEVSKVLAEVSKCGSNER